MSDNIPPSDPTTCQVEIDPGKSYEAIIGSDGNKFEALLNRLSREKIKINVFITHYKTQIIRDPF